MPTAAEPESRSQDWCDRAMSLGAPTALLVSIVCSRQLFRLFSFLAQRI